MPSRQDLLSAWKGLLVGWLLVVSSLGGAGSAWAQGGGDPLDSDGDGIPDDRDALPNLRIFARFDLPAEAWTGEPIPVRVTIEDLDGAPIPEIPPVRFQLSAPEGVFPSEARQGVVLEGGGTSSVLVEAREGVLDLDYLAVVEGTIRFEVADPESFGVSSSGPEPTVQRINCGGAAYVDTLGQAWSADAFFDSGHSYLYDDGVQQTDDDRLYQTERYFPRADGGYGIPVEPGLYRVRLHFVEMCFWCSQRVFDVLLEGETVLSGLDLAVDPGYFLPFVGTFDVDVEDGYVQIAFADISEAPKIAAIEVIGLGSVRGLREIWLVDGDADPDDDGLTNREEALTGTDRLNPDSDTDGVVDGTDPFPLTVLEVELSPSTPSYRGLPSRLTVTLSRADGLPLDPGERVEFTLVATGDAVFEGVGEVGTILQGEGTSEVRVETEGASAEVIVVGSEPEVTIQLVDSRPAGIRLEPTWESLYRVNCGGPSYTDAEGRLWEADSYYWGGSSYAMPDLEIDATDDDELFRTERYGDFGYTLFTGPGAFEVRLLFAEIWSGAMTPGIRVFNVEVQGELVLTEFDIVANVSWAEATERTFLAEVPGEELTLHFPPVVQNPKISALEISRELPSKAAVTMELSEPPGPAFRRGDANADGVLNIGDPTKILRVLFIEGTLPCLDAAEADDDGALDISDAIWILRYLFLGLEAPAAPFPACGVDPTDDGLGCESFAPCGSGGGDYNR